MKNLVFAGAFGAALAITPVIAQADPETLGAQTATAASTEATIEAIVDNGRTTENGVTYPATGRATPVENWFGCKPSNEKEACARGGQAVAGARSDEKTEMRAGTSAEASAEAKTRSETELETRDRAMSEMRTDGDADLSVDADAGVRVQ